MSLSDNAENHALLLLFNNTNWSNVGDATGLRGSTTAGSFYISLHTANPGETGTQTTSEAAYTNYSRVAVARSSGGWTVSTNQASNAAALSWPQSGSGPETETYFIVGRDSSGAGESLFYGALTSSLVVNNNITPTAAIGAIVCTFD